MEQGRNRENRKRPNWKSRYNGVTTKEITTVRKRKPATSSQTNATNVITVKMSTVPRKVCRCGYNHDELKPSAAEMAIAASAIKVRLVRCLRMTCSYPVRHEREISDRASMKRQYNGPTTQPIAIASINNQSGRPTTSIDIAWSRVPKKNTVCGSDNQHTPAVKEATTKMIAKGIRLTLDFCMTRFYQFGTLSAF
jgi:hypothetical protein